MEQAEIEGGNLNLEYYMQLDLSENQYVSRAITAIQEDFARKLSIESISDDLGVSASYLSRKFKEVTGQTFLDFLNKYRVQQAIVMLGTRQYRISEISEATGFTDYKHFCSVFKKYTSKSPTKFIKGVS
jgi:two-component system response regulator YesN